MMSKSRRHTPIRGMAGGSEKKDKKYIHKKLRKKSKFLLQNLFEEYIEPKKEEMLDEWNMAKDGKIWFGDFKDKEKLMRK